MSSSRILPCRVGWSSFHADPQLRHAGAQGGDLGLARGLSLGLALGLLVGGRGGALGRQCLGDRRVCFELGDPGAQTLALFAAAAGLSVHGFIEGACFVVHGVVGFRLAGEQVALVATKVPQAQIIGNIINLVLPMAPESRTVRTMLTDDRDAGEAPSPGDEPPLDHSLTMTVLLGCMQTLLYLPLPAALAAAERALAVGAFVDPTLWRDKHLALEQDIELIRLALPFWRRAQAIKKGLREAWERAARRGSHDP